MAATLPQSFVKIRSAIKTPILFLSLDNPEKENRRSEKLHSTLDLLIFRAGLNSAPVEIIENLPLVASASKGGLTLALRQVAVTIFNLTLGGVTQS